MPTYNEAGNLPFLLEGIMAQSFPGPAHVFLIDDNSPDGTADLAEHLAPEYGGAVTVLRRRAKLGLGTAYVAGFSKALSQDAEYVIEMDADLSHNPDDIPRLIAAAGIHGVAVGSRWCPGGRTDPTWGLGRRLLSRSASQYARVVLGLQVRDTTTGFKCFSRLALEQLDLGKLGSTGFVFQVEVAYACRRRGIPVVEVPILFRDRTRGKSKMSARIIAEALWKVLALRFKG